MGADGEQGRDAAPPNVESEVKFLVADLAALRGRLLAAGATLRHPRTYERNVRLDTPDGALLGRQALLRLRQDQGIRLTFKGDTIQADRSEVKVREELEVAVSDFDLMAAILTRLGFGPVQVYEKYRETFRLGQVEVVLDEMPYGMFVEIEGHDESAIRAAAATLGLDWSKRLLTNYLALMAMVKEARALPFDDVTFANFARYPVDMADFLPECE